MLLAFTLFYMITQCCLASSSRALSIDVPDVLPTDGRGNLFLQLVPDEVPSTDDLADLEDTVCLEALERFRSIRVPEGGRVDWGDSRQGFQTRRRSKQEKGVGMTSSPDQHSCTTGDLGAGN